MQKEQELGKEIQIIFWEDIKPIIAQNDMLLEKYYPQFYNHKKSNNISIETLRDTFNCYIDKYDIIDFIRSDPFIGIRCYSISNVDDFCSMIYETLKRAILIQNSDVFKSIKRFRDLLENYNTNLGFVMDCCNENYFKIFKYKRDDKQNEKIKKSILEVKKELNKLYSEINDGCNLFF